MTQVLPDNARRTGPREQPPARPNVWRRGLGWFLPGVTAFIHRLRLFTGLVLFTYILTHLINHAAGILSLETMEAGQPIFYAIWTPWFSTWLLYGSLITHFLLALWSIFRRRRLRMPPWEAAQLLLGLMIPPVLVDHIIGTRIAYELFEVDTSYTYVIYALISQPIRAVLQALFLVIAWTHGCIGLNYWLRLKSWYVSLRPLLAAAALLIPVLALIGYMHGAQQLMAMERDPEWLLQAVRKMNLPDAGGVASLYAQRDWIYMLLAGLLGLALAGRWVRRLLERRHGVIRLTYPGGKVLRLAPGLTVLEISRASGIPHASVCGGRGRCSTCRVRVGVGLDALPGAAAEEERVLTRVNAGENVRLACQIRPVTDIEITPLLPPNVPPSQAHPQAAYHFGQELEIAVLFADLRGFTTLSEQRLPFDVVFILNRYCAEMGAAIESAGGYVDKFIGDGVMALFGLDDGPKWGAIGAVTAAQRMIERLEILNRDLATELDKPLKLGIGVHSGHAIVGDMGYGRTVALTAIGDVVNTASRIESMTKDFAVPLIVSADAAALAGIDMTGLRREQIQLRGREQFIDLGLVSEPSRLVFTHDRRLAPRASKLWKPASEVV